MAKRALVWYGVPMIGLAIALLMLSPLLLPAPQWIASASNDAPSLLTRFATVEAKQTMYGEQFIEFRAEVRRNFEALNAKQDTQTNALITFMLTTIFGMGAALWQMRKK